MAELRQGLRLDLPDPLPGDAKLASDLLQRARVAVEKPEPELDDLLLPFGQGMEHGLELFLQQDEAGRVDGDHGVRVLDEVAEVRVLLLPDRGLEGDGLLAHLQDLAHLVGGDAHLPPDLLRERLAAQILEELSLDADELVDRLDHVHRDADRAGLVGDRSGDRLADPPRRVRRELVALGVVELLDRADEPEVALLDQIEEQHPAAYVPLRDRDHQAQVRLDQLALRELSVAFDAAQEVVERLAGLRLVGLADPVPPDPLDLAELLHLMIADRDDRLGHQAKALLVDPVLLLRELAEHGRELARLDAPGEIDLLGGREEGDLADLLQVHPDGVVRGRLQEIHVELALGGPVDLVAGDLDDLDPLAAKMLLDLGQELLDLFGSEVVDGNS